MGFWRPVKTLASEMGQARGSVMDDRVIDAMVSGEYGIVLFPMWDPLDAVSSGLRCPDDEYDKLYISHTTRFSDFLMLLGHHWIL
ncbi:hypothetical protein GCM10009823_11610 [Brevibacterium salitolerans]|uniref:Uncharacterized protein n=1 Tax=Brevibacterium salitolerans TaxID=1403566 RepID=A0ABP5I4U9_9MICO